VRTVGDMGELPDTLPMFLHPRHSADAGNAADHPALFGAVAAVGLLESLMTASIVDDLTDTTRTATRNASARASPTPPPASSAAWPAAR
jgi:SulP family sulfate permease